MKKKFTISILFILLAWANFALAQTKDVSGSVKDAENSSPMPGVVVKVKGASSSVATDNNGRFNIKVPSSGATLTFSFIGYSTKEVAVGNQTTINVNLNSDSKDLSEVVVTALGIKRDQRSLAYTSQSVSAKDLVENKQTNVVNALQGKVAGVTISSTGGAPGQGSKIQVRGVNSIDPSSDNQPLFVIDGILMDNSTSSQGGAYGASNRAVDINPDDIESMNILRGGAATALYGLRGSNGVVVITTKSGKAGDIKVDYQSTYGFENVNKFPEMQSTYTQGWLGVYNANDFWPSFGPTVAQAKAIDPTHPDQIYNHFKDAFTTGNQFRNSINVSGGSEKFTFLSSLAHSNQNGILPTTDFKTIQGRLNTTFKPSDKFTASMSLAVSNSGGRKYNAGLYVENLVYWSPRHDINDFRVDNGTMNTYNGSNDNPRYLAETKNFNDDVLRLIGSVNLNYKPLSWLDLNYRVGVDTYRDNRSLTAPGFQNLPGEWLVSSNGSTAAPGRGLVNNYTNQFRSINSTFVASATKKFSDNFTAILRAGHDLYDRQIYDTSVEGSDLAMYNLYTLNNAMVVRGFTNTQNYRLMGIFGELALNYKDYLYLTITGRNDITSTLMKPNNSFFYPSASLSYIISDHIKLPEVISNAKFKFSYAQIGKDARAYSTSYGLASYSGLPAGHAGFTRSSQLGDMGIRPEFTNTYEGGLSMRFFKNRVGFDANLYHSVSTDQIISVPISTTTGFNTAVINAGSMRNKGIELSISGTPVKSNNFSWETTFNLSANRNKILSIREDLSEISVADEHGYGNARVTMKLIPGQSYGNLYGTEVQRYFSPEEKAAGLDKTSAASDPNRPLLINAAGFPVVGLSSDQKMLGNVQPRWITGWNNSFKYKNLSLNILFDARIGQDRYNQLGNYFSAFGISKESENRNDYKVFEGVLANGTPNTKEVWLGQGRDPKNNVDYDNGYYRNYHRMNSEYFIEKASWFRLRSLSLGYTLPKKWMQNSVVKNIHISATGNNLFLWTGYKGFDPESSTSNSGSNVEGFAGMTYPAVRSFLFSLNIGF